MKILGLINPIIEIDTHRHSKTMNSEQWCELLEKRIQWIQEHLSPKAKVLINFRDFSDAMFSDMTPVLKIAYFLGSMPNDSKPFGIMFEEPTGNYLPEEIGKWCGGISNIEL